MSMGCTIRPSEGFSPPNYTLLRALFFRLEYDRSIILTRSFYLARTLLIAKAASAIG